jgi:hypothetical protein
MMVMEGGYTGVQYVSIAGFERRELHYLHVGKGLRFADVRRTSMPKPHRAEARRRLDAPNRSRVVPLHLGIHSKKLGFCLGRIEIFREKSAAIETAPGAEPDDKTPIEWARKGGYLEIAGRLRAHERCLER